jgi:hypothetical protein
MIIIMGILLLYRDVRTIPLIILPTCFGSLFALQAYTSFREAFLYLGQCRGCGTGHGHELFHSCPHPLSGVLIGPSVVIHLSRPLALGGLPP